MLIYNQALHNFMTSLAVLANYFSSDEFNNYSAILAIYCLFSELSFNGAIPNIFIAIIRINS
mgnify:CR=1